MPRDIDFKAVQVVCNAVMTLVDEMRWIPYGSPELHTAYVESDEDYRKLDLLLDMMGTLTRMMDTRINYTTAEGKIIREWVETIVELGGRYRRELELLENLEERVREAVHSSK